MQRPPWEWWNRWLASAPRPSGRSRARVLSADGVSGDWLPLGTLVRLPGFKELRCPHAVAKPCTLTGTNLFLAASIAATPEFDHPTDVPPEFTGTQLSVPHPANGILYLKLRDDPATVQTLILAGDAHNIAAGAGHSGAGSARSFCGRAATHARKNRAVRSAEVSMPVRIQAFRWRRNGRPATFYSC